LKGRRVVRATGPGGGARIKRQVRKKNGRAKTRGKNDAIWKGSGGTKRKWTPV